MDKLNVIKGGELENDRH